MDARVAGELLDQLGQQPLLLRRRRPGPRLGGVDEQLLRLAGVAGVGHRLGPSRRRSPWRCRRSGPTAASRAANCGSFFTALSRPEMGLGALEALHEVAPLEVEGTGLGGAGGDGQGGRVGREGQRREQEQRGEGSERRIGVLPRPAAATRWDASLYAAGSRATAERRCTVWTVRWSRARALPLAAPAARFAAFRSGVGPRTSRPRRARWWRRRCRPSPPPRCGRCTGRGPDRRSAARTPRARSARR